MPFALTDWDVEENDDGSLDVWYLAEGTDTAVTDVMGAALLQGITRLVKFEPGVGEVVVELSDEWTAAVDGEQPRDRFKMIPIPATRP